MSKRRIEVVDPYVKRRAWVQHKKRAINNTEKNWFSSGTRHFTLIRDTRYEIFILLLHFLESTPNKRFPTIWYFFDKKSKHSCTFSFFASNVVRGEEINFTYEASSTRIPNVVILPLRNFDFSLHQHSVLTFFNFSDFFISCHFSNRPLTALDNNAELSMLWLPTSYYSWTRCFRQSFIPAKENSCTFKSIISPKFILAVKFSFLTQENSSVLSNMLCA